MTANPIKWHGGKHYLAKRIIELMPPHLHYVEPYFGGGAVLFARDPSRDWLIDDQWKLKNGETVPACLKGCSEVVNDINGELMNFWECLRSHFNEVSKELLAIPVSEGAFDWSGNRGLSMVDRAVHFFVRYRQSRQGLGKDFATLSRSRTRGRVNEQANSYWGAIDGLPEAHERLRNVVILNRDAVDVIESQDGENTLFYCDPPYLHETRSSTGEYGNNEMTIQEHDALLTALSEIDGKFILSGYPSKLYDDVAVVCGWRRIDWEIDNKASSQKTKPKKTECVWMNFS